VCNPPYRRPGSGRISAGDERRLARHEFNGELADFLSAAAVMIRNRGRAAFVHLAARAADVLSGMRALHLEPKRLRMVHSQAEVAASLVLVEGVKGGRAGLAVHPPLVLYSAPQKYSAEAAVLIAGNEAAEMNQEPERRRE
jgi:tRNA1Val (adenine37-N6)-methyltransferase